MRVLDLFSGIGGFSLGLERAGVETVAFCEIDPYCRKVLAKHWPEIPCHDDIRTLRGAHTGPVDLICGGFPCQDISAAGKGAGMAGARSGLWSEFARLIGEIQPRYAIVENVAALLNRGMGTVLGDLAALGYRCRWDSVPASAVGAFHYRQRVWIVAYPHHDGLRLQGRGTLENRAWGEQQFSGLVQDTLRTCVPTGRMGGISDGIPGRVDRLKGLGNAVVPQIVELIGLEIMRHERTNGYAPQRQDQLGENPGRGLPL